MSRVARVALDAWHDANDRAWPALDEALRPARAVYDRARRDAFETYRQALPAARLAVTRTRRARDEAATAYRDAQSALVAVRDALADAREAADEAFARAAQPARQRFDAATRHAWNEYERLSDD